MLSISVVTATSPSSTVASVVVIVLRLALVGAIRSRAWLAVRPICGCACVGAGTIVPIVRIVCIACIGSLRRLNLRWRYLRYTELGANSCLVARSFAQMANKARGNRAVATKVVFGATIETLASRALAGYVSRLVTIKASLLSCGWTSFTKMTILATIMAPFELGTKFGRMTNSSTIVAFHGTSWSRNSKVITRTRNTWACSCVGIRSTHCRIT